MKTSSMSVLLAIGCFGMLLSVPAAAQDSSKTVISAPAPTIPSVPQNGITANGSPQAAGTAPAAQGNASVPGNPAAPGNASTSGNPAVDNSLLIDNGLWEGADVGPCCANCGGGSCSPADWYTQQGVRFFGRTRPRGISLGFHEFVDNPVGTSNVLITYPEALSNRTPSPNFAPAYNMTIGHYFARDSLNRDHFIEFTFWGLDSFRDEASANSTARVTLLGAPLHNADGTFVTGNLVSSYYLNTGDLASGINVLSHFFVFGFDGADSYRATFSSTNQNFEINGRISPRGEADRLVLDPNGRWRRECQPGMYMSYLYGIRFMQLNETFRFHGEGTYDFTPSFQSADYDVVAHNNLLGLQFGADMTFRQCRWDWGVKSKVGPFVNFADQTSSINTGPVFQDTTQISSGLNQRLAASKHVASLIGEVSFASSYKFRPNLVGHASYDFMWMTGLASAPEQLQFTVNPVNKINTNGTIFYHGPSLGLEWLW